MVLAMGETQPSVKVLVWCVWYWVRAGAGAGDRWHRQKRCSCSDGHQERSKTTGGGARTSLGTCESRFPSFFPEIGRKSWKTCIFTRFRLVFTIPTCSDPEIFCVRSFPEVFPRFGQEYSHPRSKARTRHPFEHSPFVAPLQLTYLISDCEMRLTVRLPALRRCVFRGLSVSPTPLHHPLPTSPKPDFDRPPHAHPSSGKIILPPSTLPHHLTQLLQGSHRTFETTLNYWTS